MTAWSFSDASSVEARTQLWRWIQEERLGNVIMSHLDRPATLQDWLDDTDCTNGGVVWSIDHDGISYGVAHVQDGINGIPFGHISIWKAGRKWQREIGSAAVKMAATVFDSKAVLALFPAKYRHVRNACLGWGFYIMGTLPGGCVLRGKPADATLAIWRA